MEGWLYVEACVWEDEAGCGEGGGECLGEALNNHVVCSLLAVLDAGEGVVAVNVVYVFGAQAWDGRWVDW